MTKQFQGCGLNKSSLEETFFIFVGMSSLLFIKLQVILFWKPLKKCILLLSIGDRDDEIALNHGTFEVFE